MLNERLKITFLTGVISVVICIILVRILYLEIVKHDFYKKHALKQSFANISMRKDRGLIYDRNGNTLTENILVASIYTYGKDVKDLWTLKTIFKSAGIPLTKKTLNRIKRRKGFVWLKRGVDISTAQQITQKLKITNYIVQEKRFYPENSLFSEIVGFTGVDNQGLYGIEVSFEKLLKGKKVELLTLKDSHGNNIVNYDKYEYEKPISKLYLTVDSDLQKIAELILKEDIKIFKAKKAIAVAMDVKTGEILFDVTLPGFNPNKFYKYNKERWKNGSTNFLFEPGSIFKPVTFGYMLSQGLNINKKVNCENGRYKIYNHTIKDVHKYKTISAEEVLIHSSNIGTVKLNKEYDSKLFYQFLLNAGFGKKTGIVGLSEENGYLRNVKKWSGLSKASISIGQEILITPIQILRYYAAIANGGTLITPKIVKNYYGNVSYKKKDSYVRIFDRGIAQKLQTLLRDVVLEGTGQNASLDFIGVAGKTGTAQKFDIKKRLYSKKDYVAGFAGFFPAENPQIAMLIIYDSPKKSIYGGSTAAISFRKIVEQIAIIKNMHIKEIRMANAHKNAS